MMFVWALIPQWIKVAFFRATLTVLVLWVGIQVGRHSATEEMKIEQLKANLTDERERAKDDAKLRNLSDYDFCRLALKRRGLPVDQCDGLRGVEGE